MDKYKVSASQPATHYIKDSMRTSYYYFPCDTQGESDMYYYEDNQEKIEIPSHLNLIPKCHQTKAQLYVISGGRPWSPNLNTAITHGQKVKWDLIVQRETERGRLYLPVDRHRIKFYSSKRNPHSCYETITENQPRRFYLDIEFLWTTRDDVNERINQLIRFTLDLFGKFTLDKLTAYGEDSSGTGESGWFKGKEKASIHLKFKGVYFPDATSLQRFFRYFDSEIMGLNPPWAFWERDGSSATIYDINVYNTNQHMRLPHNTKLNSVRRLEPFLPDGHNYVLIGLGKEELEDEADKEFPINDIPQVDFDPYAKRMVPGPRKPPGESVESKIFAIPGSVRQPKSIWLTIGKICKALTTPDDEAFDLWTRWTLQQDQYDNVKPNKIDTMSAIWKSLTPMNESYAKTLLHKLSNNNIIQHIPFDPKDPFTWYDLMNKYHRVAKEGRTLALLKQEFAKDLKRVYGQVDNGRIRRVTKNIDGNHVFMKMETDFVLLYQPIPEKKAENKEEKKPGKEKPIYKEIKFTELVSQIRQQISYSAIEYTPSPPNRPKIVTSKHALNIFPGWASDGSVENQALIQPLLDHILSVIVGGDETVNKYFLDWLAHIIQRPEEKTRKCIILYSKEQQVGKGLLINFLRTRVFGSRLLYQANGQGSLAKQFNNLLDGKLLINVDEAREDQKANQDLYDKLKNMITESTQEIEKKNVDSEIRPSYLNFLVTTNNSRSVWVDHHDSRNVFIECSNHRRGDESYFKNLLKITEHPDAGSAFINFLLQRKNIDIYKIPQTKLLLANKYYCLPSSLRFLIDFKKSHKGEEIKATDLYAEYRNWCAEKGESNKQQRSFGIDIKDYITKVKRSGGYIYSVDTINPPVEDPFADDE